MAKQPTVLLFDIDGTLVTTGGAGRRAIETAFGELHGNRAACASFNFGGMTDRAICRGGLKALGVDATDAAIDSLLAVYLRELEREIARVPAASYYLHRGMTEAIDESHKRGCAVGLGTGNIKEGAKLKLERVGVYARFDFGGFGCDHEDRVELIRRGAERGAAKLSAKLADCRVVVIGDTPKDVHAAHGIGASCVAVATGGFTAEQLEEAGADHVFAHLAVDGALDALFG